MGLSSKSAFKNIGAAREGSADTMAKWLERIVIACLFLFAAAAPHSIAATQTAWLLGMLFWIVRFAFYPPPDVHRTPVDYALIGFFILTGISSFFSYEPLVSIGKLRAASLFTIAYLVAQNVPSRRVMRLLALTLIVSCLVNVFFSLGERVWGRGIKVHDVSAQSPLAAGGQIRCFRGGRLDRRTWPSHGVQVRRRKRRTPGGGTRYRGRRAGIDR